MVLFPVPEQAGQGWWTVLVSVISWSGSTVVVVFVYSPSRRKKTRSGRVVVLPLTTRVSFSDSRKNFQPLRRIRLVQKAIPDPAKRNRGGFSPKEVGADRFLVYPKRSWGAVLLGSSQKKLEQVALWLFNQRGKVRCVLLSNKGAFCK